MKDQLALENRIILMDTQKLQVDHLNLHSIDSSPIKKDSKTSTKKPTLRSKIFPFSTFKIPAKRMIEKTITSSKKKTSSNMAIIYAFLTVALFCAAVTMYVLNGGGIVFGLFTLFFALAFCGERFHWSKPKKVPEKKTVPNDSLPVKRNGYSKVGRFFFAVTLILAFLGLWIFVLFLTSFSIGALIGIFYISIATGITFLLATIFSSIGYSRSKIR